MDEIIQITTDPHVCSTCLKLSNRYPIQGTVALFILDAIPSLMRNMDRDSQSGRFEQTYSDSEFIAAVRKYDPASTQEIADELGIHRRSAQHRLDNLADSGQVSKKKVGNSLVWFSPSDTQHEQAFEEFAAHLTEQWGDEIKQIILYGSTARGEARGIDSDVDVMVITETAQARDTVYDPTYDIAFDVMLEHGVGLSLNFKTTEELENQRDRRCVKNVIK
jgi:predicted nucleotidyltransferase/biotin operon repressor